MDRSTINMGKCPHWETKTGEKIPISQMSDTHIQRAYAMLKRKGFISPETLYFYLTCSPPNGEIAEYYFEQELEEIISSPVSPFLTLFEQEANKREIKLNERIEPWD